MPRWPRCSTHSTRPPASGILGDGTAARSAEKTRLSKDALCNALPLDIQAGVPFNGFPMAPLVYTRQDSAFGPLLLLARDGYLTGLYFADRAHAPGIAPAWRHEDAAPIFIQVRLQLTEFAAGHRFSFSVPYVLNGTPFQRQVWREIAAVPYGETRSYGGLAARLGAFPRAVGTATGRNPISLIVPCHRVVGASGALTGYAGGLERKQRLLELETASFATCHAIAA